MRAHRIALLYAMSIFVVSACGSRVPISIDGSSSTDNPMLLADGSSLGTVDGAFVDDTLDACESGMCQVRPCVPTTAMGVYNPPPGPTPVNADWSYGCQLVFGWGWDGTECIPIVGCQCQGVDCSDLLPRSSTCKAAYAHCLADSAP
jgi:hypothetical protein